MHRWTGSTDGVGWVAESVSNVSGGNTRDRQHNRRRHVARWHGDFESRHQRRNRCDGCAQGQGGTRAHDRRRQTDSSRSSRRRPRASRSTGRLTSTLVRGRASGWMRAPCIASTRRRPVSSSWPTARRKARESLQQGLERALVDAAADKNSVLSDEDRPWILLQPGAVRLARMERFRDINELEAFVRAGVSVDPAVVYLSDDAHLPELYALDAVPRRSRQPLRFSPRRPVRSRPCRTRSTCRRAPARARSR